ncbi:MAG: hypothetical protein ABI282_01340, partial [Candidatus Baltobacteraceae bacterium]
MRLRDVFSRLSLLALAALLANCGGAGGTLTPTAPANHTRTAMLARNPFAAPPSGFAGTRAAFQHSLVCDNGMLIANYAKTYGITTIFVPVGGDDIVSLLANNPTTVKNLNAMSAVAKVYMVTGDVSWLSSPTKVPSDVPSLVKIAQMYPQVAGVLYSVDPEASSSWNSSKRQALLQQYFTLIQTLLAVPGRSAFSQIFFLAHPDFATVKYGGQQASPTVLSQLQKPAGITGTVMIVPGNSESTQLANVSTALPQLSKPFWIEASTSKYGGQNYNGVTPAYLQSNLS